MFWYLGWCICSLLGEWCLYFQNLILDFYQIPSHRSILLKLISIGFPQDETGVYKNLLQEISQRVGAPLPQYTTFRSGLGHQPVFTGTVELTGIIFTGEPAKNKKQAEKNAAMAAWSCLKQCEYTLPFELSVNRCETIWSYSLCCLVCTVVKESDVLSEPEKKDQLEQVTIARALLNYKSKEKFAIGGSSSSKILFPKLSSKNPRPSSPQPSVTSSKILPLICPKTSHRRRSYSPAKDNVMPPMLPQRYNPAPKFLASGASPYIPIDQFRAASCRGLAPPVTVRTAVPVYAAPPPRPPSTRISSPLVRIAPPGCINPAAPAVVDNLLLRIQQQESTPAIAPLPLVNNLQEPVVSPPRPSFTHAKAGSCSCHHSIVATCCSGSLAIQGPTRIWGSTPDTVLGTDQYLRKDTYSRE